MEVARSFKLPHHTSLSRTLSEASKDLTYNSEHVTINAVH